MPETNELLGDSSEELTLASLNEETVSLDDVTTSPLYNIKTSDTSNKQLATNTALLNGDATQAAQAFKDIDTEMTIEGTRKEQERVAEEAVEETLPQVQDALVNVLLDDTVSPEGKEQAARLALDKTSELFNVRKQLTSKQLAKPLASGNQEAERVRGNFASRVDLVNDQLKDQRALLNSRVAAVDSNTATAVVESLRITQEKMQLVAMLVLSPSYNQVALSKTFKT